MKLKKTTIEPNLKVLEDCWLNIITQIEKKI